MLLTHKDKRIDGYADEQQDEVTEVNDGLNDADNPPSTDGDTGFNKI